LILGKRNELFGAQLPGGTYQGSDFQSPAALAAGTANSGILEKAPPLLTRHLDY
jgi:hypothetical protein